MLKLKYAQMKAVTHTFLIRRNSAVPSCLNGASCQAVQRHKDGSQKSEATSAPLVPLHMLPRQVHQQRRDEDGCLVEEGSLGCTDELQGQQWTGAGGHNRD